jgi:hypothetical protein
MVIWRWVMGILVLGSTAVYAQFTPSGNVSPVSVGILGTIQGTYHSQSAYQSDDHVGIEELELAVQGQVYPGVDATWVMSVHPDGDEFAIDIENGFLSFSSIADGLGAKIGRQFLPFGKQNMLHPEQWPSVTKPLVLSEFLGEDNLGGDGIAFDYILPVPMFARLDVGHFGKPSSTLNNARLWTSFELSNDMETEWGVSAVQGNGFTFDGQATIYGTDLTFRYWIDAHSRLMLQGEYLELHQTDTRRGGFWFASYRPDRIWEWGTRLDWSESVVSGESSRALSAMLTQKLSETYFGRVQYQHDLVHNNPTVLAQLIFNLGSHTHALQ